MSSLRVLAFSSSRVGNSTYLEKVVPVVNEFLTQKPLKIAFVPFASVNSYEDYLAMVTTAFSGAVYSFEVVTEENAYETIKRSDAIMVGGGNTFKLLHNLYSSNVIERIRQKVFAGTPYIGWSAGSNITGLSISTTNDMPIIQPESFKGLQLFPFQINPHYLNEEVAGHNGETRDQRIAEFVKINPGVPIICLPEGSHLEMELGTLRYVGMPAGFLFTGKLENNIPVKESIVPGADLSFLL